MEVKLQEAYNRALDDADMLEFELEGCEDIHKYLSLSAQIIKKQYYQELIKIMLPMESQLSEADFSEYRNILKEWSSKVDSVEKAFQSGERIDCDESSMDILYKMTPYLKNKIKDITYYKKSKQLQIAM